MKWLVATNETQGERPGDFNWCAGSEQLFPPVFICDADRVEGPDGGCGCGRSYAGIISKRSTTTMMVTEVDLTEDDLLSAIIASHRSGGWTEAIISDEEIATRFRAVKQIISGFDIGDIVEKREDLQIRRKAPQEDGRYPYKCPKCGDTDQIDVCADIWVRIVQEGNGEFETDVDIADNNDHSFDGNHGAICQACGYGDNLDKFEVEDDEEDSEYDENGQLTCRNEWCGAKYDDGGDGYDGLCPSCADKAEQEYECQDCEKRWSEEELRPIKDIGQRVAAGEPMPAGECPECGALCHKRNDAETEEDPRQCQACGGVLYFGKDPIDDIVKMLCATCGASGVEARQ